jgi:hypothetical protein
MMGGPNFLGLGQLQVDSSSISYFVNCSVGIGGGAAQWRFDP